MPDSPYVLLASTVTCPSCGTRTEAEMQTDACQFFWACPACGEVIRPRPGDCCVFCSYADVPCPPVQRDDACSC
jgi:phage terminase large subunit GpA-like protein